MAFGASMNVSGLQGLRQALLEMPNDLKKRTLRRVLRKQSKVVLAEIKSVMPRHPDSAVHLADLMRVAAGKTTNKGEVIRDGAVYPTREELGISPKDPYYWPFALEYGHVLPYERRASDAKRKRTENERSKLPVAPRPYVRNSWDRKESQAANSIEVDTFEAIKQVWSKSFTRRNDTLGQLNRDLAASLAEVGG